MSLTVIIIGLVVGFSIHFIVKRKERRVLIENYSNQQIAQSQKVMWNELVNAMYVVLENLKLFKTTRNFEVLEQRFILLRHNLLVIERYQEWHLFSDALRSAEDWFVSNYFGSIVEADERMVIINSSEYLQERKWTDFQAFVLLETMRRFVQRELLDLDELKTIRGKKNRLLKILREFEKFTYYFPYLKNHPAMIEIEKVVDFRNQQLGNV